MRGERFKLLSDDFFSSTISGCVDEEKSFLLLWLVGVYTLLMLCLLNVFGWVPINIQRTTLPSIFGAVH